MTTVREATIDLCRARGLTTWFGNPGSSELTLLQDFPDDFRYLLGLQEMVPVGMADGWAQITGGPAIVCLHTAPGLGTDKAPCTTPTPTRRPSSSLQATSAA